MPPSLSDPDLQFNRYDAFSRLNPNTKTRLSEFLFQHLGQYGDPLAQIQSALEYAVKERPSFGGFVLEAQYRGQTAGVVVINGTGMGGYIPENILVYIAVDGQLRGMGLGKRILEEALKQADGDVALHVEENNPAKRLYERVGFTNPYLEMRYKAKA
jgi:ribosomal protein S18 acetylase RimI-like enzyme